MKTSQVCLAIVATLLLTSLPAFSREDGMVNAVEVGVVNGSYTFTPVEEEKPAPPAQEEETCPVRPVAVDETPHYQTRVIHDQAPQIDTSSFARKSDVENLASKSYVNKADKGIISGIKTWVDQKITPLTDRLCGLEKSDSEQNKGLTNHETRLLKMEKTIYGDNKTKTPGLVDRMVLAERQIKGDKEQIQGIKSGLNWTLVIAALALLAAIIAIIMRLSKPSWLHWPRSRREEVPIEIVEDADERREREEREARERETPEQREARARKNMGLPNE